MSKSWKDAAKSERKSLPFGFEFVAVNSCMRFKKSGEEFKTAKGAFLLVVYGNEDGAESTVSYFLTDKAQWKLARDLSRLGVDMDELDGRGVGIADFADQDFAANEMMGRTSWAKISATDSKYPDVELVTPDSVPPAVRAKQDDAQPEPTDTTPPDDDRPPDGEPEMGGDGVDDDKENLPF